jgi:hypothetical protein
MPMGFLNKTLQDVRRVRCLLLQVLDVFIVAEIGKDYINSRRHASQLGSIVMLL